MSLVVDCEREKIDPDPENCSWDALQDEEGWERVETECCRRSDGAYDCEEGAGTDDCFQITSGKQPDCLYVIEERFALLNMVSPLPIMGI